MVDCSSQTVLGDTGDGTELPRWDFTAVGRLIWGRGAQISNGEGAGRAPYLTSSSFLLMAVPKVLRASVVFCPAVLSVSEVLLYLSRHRTGSSVTGPGC